MSNAFFLHSLSPSTDSQDQVIAQLDKAQANGFIKGIQAIISHCNPKRLSIKNSIVTHWFSDSSGIVSVDFRSLLESDVSLSFISDHSLIRSLSNLTNGSDLVISESASGHKYRLIADKSEVCLSKIDGHRVKQPDLSDLANGSIGSSIEIDDTRPLQINAKAGSVQLQTYGGQLASVIFNNGLVHHFSKITLCEAPDQPDLAFRSYPHIVVNHKLSKLLTIDQNNFGVDHTSKFNSSF